MSENGRVHLDLSADGFEGQWVDLCDIGAKSPEQYEEIAGQASDQSEEGARAFLQSVVLAWNVVRPKTGEALPAPGSAEWRIGYLPLRVIKRITDNVAEQLEAALPKGNWRTS